MKYFFWCCLNAAFNNSNIVTVNAIQKKFVYLYEMGEQIHILQFTNSQLKVHF